MSDTYAAHFRQNSQGDVEFYDPSTGTTLLAFRNATSAFNPTGVAATDLSISPAVIMPASLGNYKKLSFTAAQINALGASPPVPQTLLPAPGAGLSTVILDAVIALNFGSGAFTGGSTLAVQQNSLNVCTTSNTLIQTASSIVIQPAFPGLGTTQSYGAPNAATLLTVAGAAFAGGAGCTVDVHLWYSTITP